MDFSKKLKRVLLGLGSNRTYNNLSPVELLSYAREELSCIMSSCIFSSIYKTKAMYVTDQEDFYNMAAAGYIKEEINAFDFLKTINGIEAKYGRDRTREIRFGPRSLDIDIELFGDEIINHPDLQIPHIRMEERAFVLIPALEILNDSADELIRKKYSDCLAKLQKNGKADDIEKFLDNSEMVENGNNRKFNKYTNCCKKSI